MSQGDWQNIAIKSLSCSCLSEHGDFLQLIVLLFMVFVVPVILLVVAVIVLFALLLYALQVLLLQLLAVDEMQTTTLSYNGPFVAKPSCDLLFIKLWAATLQMPELENAMSSPWN